MKTEPISPGDKTIHYSESLIEECVQFLNMEISQNRFDKYSVSNPDYNAVVLKPAGHFNPVLKIVVDLFIDKGWDCFSSYAYDPRGPHYCFYVHKKHFSV